MNQEAKEFIETERMMNEVKSHYIMQGMWNAFELLNAERRRRRDDDSPVSVDDVEWYEWKLAGFQDAVGLLHNNLRALDL